MFASETTRLIHLLTLQGWKIDLDSSGGANICRTFFICKALDLSVLSRNQEQSRSSQYMHVEASSKRNPLHFVHLPQLFYTLLPISY
jgi:hypothetical protein